MSTIPLAKPFNRAALEKMGGPYGVSIKYDGVPVKVTLFVDSTGRVTETVHCSRQGKPLPVLDVHVKLLQMEISQYANTDMRWPEGTYVIVAETIHPKVPDFKDLSGIVRSHIHELAAGLRFNVFDFWHDKGPVNYDTRMYMAGLLFNRPRFGTARLSAFEPVPMRWYDDLDAAISSATAYAEAAILEGAIIRSGADRFEVGKRSWGYQKVVLDPTVDLAVHSFEEAVSADGAPLGMVGRINCYFRGEPIGVGPGKLTHDERRVLWSRWLNQRVSHVDTLIAEVKYKRDPSYNALRQPTFQRWRTDKDETNEEV